jgi:DNA-binding CsgD family transcriptional regulator
MMLSKRELEILDRLLLGDSSKEIASGLDIKSRTVETHIANMLLKTGTKSRMKLVAAYRTSTLRNPKACTPFDEFLLTAKNIEMTADEARQILVVLLSTKGDG